MQGSGYSCVVKLRCSKGLRCTGFLAPWPTAPGSTDNSAFELPRISADVSFAFTLEPEYEAESEEDLYYSRRDNANKFHYVQTAVLYTNVKGERKLRVHTTSIGITTAVRFVFQSACIGPLMAFLIKKAASIALERRPGSKLKPRDFLLEFALRVLSTYQRHCYSADVGIKSLVIHKRLNLLPIYVLGARKLFYSVLGAGIEGNEFLRKLLRMPIHSVLAAIYPRVYPLELLELCETEGEVSREQATSPRTPPQSHATTQSPAHHEKLATPLAPMVECVVKGAWPAYIITNGVGAWLYRTPTGRAAYIESRDEAKLLKNAVHDVCTQIRDMLEPNPVPLPLTEIVNLSSSASESRDQKVLMATLFIEDEGFTEMSYTDWVHFLQGQVLRMLE